MATEIGPLAVRRSIWIEAEPDRVWEEFESLDQMRRWYGTGHSLIAYEPRVGAEVVTDAGASDGDALRFVGKVLVYDPPQELSFEQDWVAVLTFDEDLISAIDEFHDNYGILIQLGLTP